MNKQETMSMLNCSIDQGSLTISSPQLTNVTSGSSETVNSTWNPPQTTCWDYWQNSYYPYVIQPSYPVYIQERAKDKGKQAFEIIKILKDKKLIKMEKVGDFIDLMDSLINIL